MEIGGKDTLIIPNIRSLMQREVRALIGDHWPQCVCQEDGGFIFYFENQEAMDSWGSYGRTEGNADTMIHAIYDEPYQITIVTDGPHTEKILADLQKTLTAGHIIRDGAWPPRS